MREDKNTLCFLLLLYGVIFALFHDLPAFLKSFFRKPLTWGDTLDFLTPFVVIPLVYFLYHRIKKILHSLPRSPKKQITLTSVMLGFASLLYVDGHGLHLSSNSVARLLQNMKETELYKANYLFDEIISHYIWHTGIFLISISLIILAYMLPLKTLSISNIVLLSIGAAFYGFNFSVDGIEGQTVVFSILTAGLGFLLASYLYLRRKKEGAQNPVLLFFSIGYFMSLLLFAYWGISHSGFPQFSELGWI
ncbi:MAG: hypothetical protein JSV96_07840 [Candidatus Aminicenantes bacterium]|nr:MAG: hypothetical protein JSV96_07840 [Candidatus Aminicenantes bacterium]